MDLATIVDTYQAAKPMLSHLLRTTIVAEGVYLVSDAIAQLAKDKKLNPKRLAYTAILAPFYGLTIEGLVQSGELVGRYISENPLVKAALGPNLWGNLSVAAFYVNNTVGEKSNYSICALVKNYASALRPRRLKGYLKAFKQKIINNIPGKEFLYSVAGSLTAWNAFQWYNYSYVPPDIRSTTTLGAVLAWTIVLTAWALRGARRLSRESQ